jgi:hypothetical protein
LRNQRIHLRHGRNFHYTARRHVTAIAAANAIAPVVSSENNSGILIARGFEQWMSVPALLLLCPFAGLVCTLATLDNNDYNWQICVVDRNVRRLVYGFQCGGFSALLFLGIEFLGGQFVIEAFPGLDQNAPCRMFQKQLACLIAACGIGLSVIEDTLARETSIFATCYAFYALYTGWVHISHGLPAVLSFAFIWNGAQLLILAWVGGTVTRDKG